MNLDILIALILIDLFLITFQLALIATVLYRIARAVEKEAE